MSAKILDGKWLASIYEQDIHRQCQTLSEKFGSAPGLAVILVGDNPASKAYVGRKGKVAARCGIQTFDTRLAASASKEEILEHIVAFNKNPEVDGILLQLPLPGELSSESDDLIAAIAPEKDVDGLHPFNQGLLLQGKGVLRSCTPLGVMKMIDLALSDVKSGDDIESTDQIPVADLSGKKAVVIGRSVLVGKPVSFLLLERNATVTIAHSRTKDLSAVVREADIVVAAVGKEHLVKSDWVHSNAIVIDVGINRTEQGTLTGDVAFDEVAQACSAITPVPGGVGQMTVAMLMHNTLLSYMARMSQ